MGQGGRLPGPTARGARIEGIEGVRGVGQLAEGDWEDWGRARARATVAGETRSRQFAVGHGRAERSRGRSPWRGASRGIDQLAVGQNGPPGPASTPNGAPRRDRGTSGRVARGPAAGGWTAVSEQYISCPGASTSTCVYIYIYVCMYVCMYRQIDRCTVTTVHCRTPAHGTGCIYISTGAVLHGLPAGPDIPRHPAMAGRTGDGDPLPTLGTAKPGTGTPPSLT